MWSELKNCEVSELFPTPEPPSMATRYCSGSGPCATSTAGVMPAQSAAAAAAAPAAAPLATAAASDGPRGTVELRREAEARDWRREEEAEQLPEKSWSELVSELE